MNLVQPLLLAVEEAAAEEGGLHFPSIGELVNWPSFFGGDNWYALNKIGLICLMASFLTLLLFIIAGSRGSLVPRGVQNIVESSVDFIRDGIVLQTMGEEGLHKRWVMPFLTSLFWFILFCNITSVIPPLSMPASARMSIPLFLALLVYLVFNVVGIKSQGPISYFKNALFPPGVPAALYILVTPIELVSTFLVRPFSLAVRLFANTLAGHILLVTFGILAYETLQANLLIVPSILATIMLLLMTGFEVMVAFLQAYIFTILAAVYIGGAMHPEH
jgi:F-type H+-transporting ATPase subunit a